MREECGVFAIFNGDDAAWQTQLGLHELNHRGEESCGIATTDGKNIFCEKYMGTVLDVFTEEIISRLPGRLAIGHNRYSTAGGSKISNAQPFVVSVKNGPVAVAHNGNITNAQKLREELEENGAVFHSTSDTEVIVQLIGQSRQTTLLGAITEAVRRLDGAFSLVFLTKDSIVAVRDTHGFKPLVVGSFDNGFVVASETCAFKHCCAKLIGEIKRAEIVVINAQGIHRSFYAEQAKPSQCIFEHVYFSRPDSKVFGSSVSSNREEFGNLLSEVLPVEADVVIGVPDSGIPAAIGYAEASGISRRQGLVRSHYTGRSFTQPGQMIRELTVRLKLSADSNYIEGKRVIVIDDSLVRGTTSKKIVQLVREAGAKEVHFRVASPPLLFGCFYGVDIPDRRKLIASHETLEEIRQYIDADTLAYLPLPDLRAPFGEEADNYCYACLNGEYPTDVSHLVRIS